MELTYFTFLYYWGYLLVVSQKIQFKKLLSFEVWICLFLIFVFYNTKSGKYNLMYYKFEKYSTNVMNGFSTKNNYIYNF